MFERPQNQEVTPEIWLQAYVKSRELSEELREKLKIEYGEDAVLVYQDIILDYMNTLHEQGETRESVTKVAAFHGMVSSTITADDFIEGESIPDLPGDKSFIQFLERKIQEIDK